MSLPLTEERLEALRRRLLEEKSEIERRTAANRHYGLNAPLRDSTGDLSTNDNHPGDEGTELFERSKDFALMEKDALRLKRIDAALERMDTGEYGRCAACERFIPYERLDALPTAIYCTEHEPMRQLSERRPVEEELLHPPFGRSSMDEPGDAGGFDGEDAWQIVESWGSSNSPAMAENPNAEYDYDNMAIEADENDGYVETIESFLATDITGRDVSVVRNRAYRQYLAGQEGEPLLEPDERVEE